ncbi:MAG TPA: hypothetical protein VFW23_11140 [Tepidisphaeraceae bacterium]|nr:hypothetical protein [Tepidisphaeraceae bacterium]
MAILIIRRTLTYLANLSAGRLALWCYFIWYLVVLVHYFDPSARLWLTSLGLSGIIGVALLVNTTRSGTVPVKLERWPIVRLFMMPFCVSSFAALVKGRGFILVFSPRWPDLAAGFGMIAAFCVMVVIARQIVPVSKNTDFTPMDANLS